MEKADLKIKLYEICMRYADKRISIAKAAVDEAQQASNAESKSTAGDKHDTSRAMMQIEAEKASKQLAEAMKQKEDLMRVNADKQYNSVMAGSLVITNTATYFISIAAGKVSCNERDFFAVSISSPIVQALKGLKIGSEILFNGKQVKILDVY